MKVSPSSDGTHATLTFSGSLTLEHARQMHEALTTTLQTHASVAVRAEDVDQFDLSFLQLICSAHRSALPQGKNLTLTFADPARVREVLGQIGFRRHRGCSWNPTKNCIWQGGDRP